MHPDKVEVITDRLKTYGFAKVGGWKLGKKIDRKMREGFDPDRLIVTRFSSSDLMPIMPATEARGPLLARTIYILAEAIDCHITLNSINFPVDGLKEMPLF